MVNNYISNTIETPLFKGATRPACVWGIPIKPFIACMGIYLLLAFWVYVPILLLAFPTLYILNVIAREDDQKFRQLFLFYRVNIFGSGNKDYWGKIASFAPASYKKSYKKAK